MRTHQFSTRVQLLSSDNRILGTVPASEAERLLHPVTGGAEIHDKHKRVIRAIRLNKPIGKPEKPSKPASIYDYMGQRYTHCERIAGRERPSPLIVLNTIDARDEHLFRLSVLDNLVG